MKIKMKLEKETKGALRYQEIDHNDQPVTTNDSACLMGTLYLRKKAMEGINTPRFIQVEVTIEEE